MTTTKAKASAAAIPDAPAHEATVQDVAARVEQVVAAGKERIETVVKASADAASLGYEKAVALTKDQVEAAVKAQNAAFRTYEDAVSFGKENVDALVKAGAIFSRGLQDIGKTVVTLAQGSVEEGVAASKRMLGAKTIREVFDLQASLTKTGFDKLVEEGCRISDMSMKMMEAAFAPIGERFSAAVDKLGKPNA